MPRIRRLSHLLLLSHVGLVLLFGLLLLATGIGTIRSAVVAQARSEAERTVSQGRRRLLDWRSEVGRAADLLAEQPTLGFYLQRDQLTKARALVEEFHATSGLEYVRVDVDGRMRIAVGRPPPETRRGLHVDAMGSAWQVEARQVDSLPSATLVVASRLGSRLADIGEAPSVTMRVLPLVAAQAVTEDPWQSALAQVSASGEPDTFEDIGESAAARVVSLRDDSGRPAVLLAARVHRNWVDRRILEWLAAFGVSWVLAVGLALALAIVLSARVGRPFAQLADAADRLGAGDLQTRIAMPDTGLAEPLALSTGLERMRERVHFLTRTERSQREQLDALLDGVDEGIAGIDADGRVHYANRQFLVLLGRERDEVLGRRAEDLLQRLEPGPSAAPGLPELPLPGERMRPLDFARTLRVRRLAAGAGQQVLVAREENALEAAGAMRDRILANLAHELQTPLAAQMASIEMLRDHLRDSRDGVALQLANAQYRGTLRLSQLVDNLLDSLRIESGEMRLRRESVDLSAIADSAIELMRPLTDQREQRVIASLPEGPAVIGDAPRLFSIAVNLLANANKFAPDRSTIRVRLEWNERTATLWVEDEGPGLPASDGGRADLFAPFRRAPRDEPGERGTGLGLAIVQAIVAAHDGEVVVGKPPEGEGAVIGVRLPLEFAT
jgi:signal transduction histidine kinase